MIVIYTREVTHRLRYILDTVVREYLGMELVVVTNPDQAPEQGIRINYSGHALPGWFSIYRSELLFEIGIREQRPFISREEGLPVIFQTTEPFDLRFDVFAAAFYVLSRYEEYLPHEQDQYGRYRSSNSLLSNPVFSFEPVVEYWLDHFKKKLLDRHPSLSFRTYDTATELTFDIDQAFAYKGRRWPKILGSLLKGPGRRVLFLGAPDPYDTIPAILDFLRNTEKKARFFFLLNDKGQHASSVNPHSALLASYIRTCSEQHTVGLHPAFNAWETGQAFAEKSLLETLTGKPVEHSRQHFLRIRFPDYFRALEAMGIRHDHSLGYPDTPGFRAGFSRPFRFYDLAAEQETGLWLHPFAFMDATFMYYQAPDQVKIIKKFSELVEQVSKVNGKLVTVSHNDLLGDDCPVDFWEVLKNCAV